jgi:hypothetical protein
MTFAPTLVIGMGGAGLRVLKTFNEMVDEYGDSQNLRCIAIDSSKDDVHKYVKIDQHISKIELTESGRDPEELIAACPYLYDGITPKGEGAVRDRVYGRFLYDIHRQEVTKTISKYLEQLRDGWQKKEGGGEQAGHLIIWIVHSIGGGTGSGSFPTLVADVYKKADQLLKKRGGSAIKPYIYCIGILPSASNIFDLNNADLNPRYFANSYAALKEIDRMAYPPEDGLVICPFESEDQLSIDKRPFLRYFILGINEEMTSTTPTPEQAHEMEDYLQNSNRIIANMMLTFPQQDGFENPWEGISSPYVPFGESELIIPIQKILKVARENDRLGRVLDDKTKDSLKEKVLSILGQADENVNNAALEKYCKTVYESFKLRGLNYFAGILQNEYRKRKGDYTSQYEQRVNDLWADLGTFEWSQAKVRNLQNLNIDQKYQKIRELFTERKEENQRNIDSLKRVLFKPLQGDTLRNNNKNIDNTLSDLLGKKTRWDTITRIYDHIDINLTRDLKIADLQGKNGVQPIQKCVEDRENALKRLKEKLMVSGSGRKISIKVSADVLDKLSLTDESRIKINPDSDVIELLEKLQYSKEEITGIIIGRVNHAAKGRDLNIRTRQKKSGDSIRQEDLFIVCNSSNYKFIEDYKNAYFTTTPKFIKSNTFDKEKFIFIDFSLGTNLDDIDEYYQRKKEYEGQNLKSKTKLTGNVGTIFAYPEWFPEDPFVRDAYTKLYPPKK